MLICVLMCIFVGGSVRPVTPFYFRRCRRAKLFSTAWLLFALVNKNIFFSRTSASIKHIDGRSVGWSLTHLFVWFLFSTFSGQFLDASSHLYKRVYPSVRRSYAYEGHLMPSIRPCCITTPVQSHATNFALLSFKSHCDTNALLSSSGVILSNSAEQNVTS